MADPQRYPPVFRRNPEAARLQVRQKTTFDLIIGVRYPIALHGTLTGDAAYF